MRRQKNIIRSYRLFLFVATAFTLLLNLSCSKNLRTDLVDYSFTLYSEFYNPKNVGKVIPLTISKSAEIDGAIANQGKYLYFASNKDGNFDIFVRGLGDIIEKPITRHAADDRSPQISPDGKKLIFVSRRDDFQGDIFLVAANPEEWLTKSGEAIDEFGGEKKIGELKNLTEIRDERNVRRSITDKDPVWSPDGKWIAFISNRGSEAKNNIWIMSANGKIKKQVTTLGAEQVSYANDGLKLIFISYRDSQKFGEIYEVGVDKKGEKTGSERRLTKNDEIEMFPKYLGDSKKIIYTRIDIDTNENGILDLNDKSYLYYQDLSKKNGYPLTVQQDYSFNVNFYPDLFGRGDSIVYIALRENNLDVSVIPATGIIPRRPNIVAQYELAEQYLIEYNDAEKYILALRRTKDFHEKHPLSYLFISRAYVNIANYYQQSGKSKIALSYLKELSEFGAKTKQNIYSILAAAYEAKITGKNATRFLEEQIESFKKGEQSFSSNQEQKNKFLNQLAFLYEALGEMAAAEKNNIAMISSYEKALSTSNKYPFYLNLLLKTGAAKYDFFSKYYDNSILPEEWLTLISATKSVSYLSKIEDNIVSKFYQEKNYYLGLQKIKTLESKYPTFKGLGVVSLYMQSFYNLGLKKYKDAVKGFETVIKLTPQTRLLHFQSLYFVGLSYEKQSQSSKMAELYHKAIEKYFRFFRSPAYHEMKDKLVSFYSTQGQALELQGNYKQASVIYLRWINLLHTLNSQALSRPLYDQIAVEAHVRYINSHLQSIKFKKDKIKKFVEQYNQKDKIDIARVTYNKAYLYGAAYLYHRLGLKIDSDYRRNLQKNRIILNPRAEISEFLEYQQKAEQELKWVTYMDEEYLDAYLLQGFIYSLVDIRRQEDGVGNDDLYNKFFPEYLLEQTISIYNKGLRINDESKDPNTEGNLYLNLANSFFLLRNYSKALENYQLAADYKTGFDSTLQEAQFFFHLAYSQWQNNFSKEASANFRKVKEIYLAQKRNQSAEHEMNQILRITQYLALIHRERGEYREAIDLYNQLLADHSYQKKLAFPLEQIYQELAYCHYKLGQNGISIDFLQRSEKILEKQPREKIKKFPLRWRLLNIKNEVGFRFDTGVLAPFLLPNLVVLNVIDKKGIPFFNLGEDGTIIGENRIYRNLNQIEKLSLNHSLFSDNYLKQGNYLQAIQFLRKKWQILENPVNSFEWQVKAITGNNLGYYYFLNGNYQEAMDFFRKTSAILSGSNYQDFQEDINSRMNYMLVLSYILENKSDYLPDPIKEIDIVINESRKYAASFKKNLYKQLLSQEESERKARKQKITKNDELRIAQKAEVSSRVSLFRLELILANLMYYKGNLLSQGRMAFKTQSIDSKEKDKLVMAQYQLRDNIYQHYRHADTKYDELIQIISGSIKKTEKDLFIPAELKNNRILLAILYTNRARIWEKMGAYPQAARFYLLSLQIAREYQMNGLSAQLAYFFSQLSLHHSGVIKYLEPFVQDMQDPLYNQSLNAGDYLRESLQYFEDDVLLALGMENLMQDVFRLAQWYQVNVKKNPNDALLIAEKENAILRLLDILQIQPQLPDKIKNETLQSYLNSIRKRHTLLQQLGEIKQNISVRSAELPTLRSELEQNLKNIKSNSLRLKLHYPELKILIHTEAQPWIFNQLHEDDILVYFKVSGSQLFTWVIGKQENSFIQKTIHIQAIEKAILEKNGKILSSFLSQGMPVWSKNKKRWFFMGNSWIYQLPLSVFHDIAPKAETIRFLPGFYSYNVKRVENQYFRNQLISLLASPNEKPQQDLSIKTYYKKNWNEISPDLYHGIFEFPASLPMQAGFALPLQPSVIFVKWDSREKRDRETLVRRWNTLATIWKTNNILFYETLPDQDRVKLLAAMKQGHFQKGVATLMKSHSTEFVFGFENISGNENEELKRRIALYERSLQLQKWHGNWAECIILVEELEKIRKSLDQNQDHQLSFSKAEAYLMLENFTEFEKLRDQLPQSYRQNAMWRTLHIRHLYARKGYHAAKKEIDALIKMNPRVSSIQVLAFEMDLREGLHQNWQKRANELLAIIGKDANTLRELALVLEQAGYGYAALPVLRRVDAEISRDSSFREVIAMDITRIAASPAKMFTFENAYRYSPLAAYSQVKIISMNPGKDSVEALKLLDASYLEIRGQESRDLRLDFFLSRARLLFRMQRYPEVISYLTSGVFSAEENLRTWHFSGKQERLELLSASLHHGDSPILYGNAVKSLLSTYEKTMNYNSYVESYAKYITFLFLAGKKSDAYKEILLFLDRFDRLPAPLRPSSTLLVDTLFIGYDLARARKEMKASERFWQRVQTIFTWRRQLREADLLWQQGKQSQAAMSYMQIVTAQTGGKMAGFVHPKLAYLDLLHGFQQILSYYRDLRKEPMQVLQWKSRFSSWKFQQERLQQQKEAKQAS